MAYLVSSPWWLRMLYPGFRWHKDRSAAQVYLTFDDGPTPGITPWVLEQLAHYDYKATFFLIGDKARQYPELIEQITAAGHLLGNHTFHHLNGWKTATEEYVADSALCAREVPSRYFRPPYGRIKKSQARKLRQQGYEIVMWDVISGDFDRNTSPETCWQNVRKNTRAGSIIVFHDSKKAWPNLRETLPKTLRYLQERGLPGQRLDQ